MREGAHRYGRPGWVVTLAAFVGLCVTLFAAYWQFGRADFKESLRQTYQLRQADAPIELNSIAGHPAEAVHFRKVTAEGEFLPEHSILLDNRLRDGVAGYEVVTPLRLAGSGDLVLINRGWTPRSADRSRMPVVETPAGAVTVAGTLIEPSERILELSGAVIEGPIWQNLVLSRYRERTGLAVADFVILQEGDGADGLVRRWEPPGFGVRTHQSYAAQWLFFAFLIVIFYVYYGFIRRPTDTALPK